MATQNCFWSRPAGWCLTGFVALFAFSMSGCSDGFILSLQPFYAEADQEADSRLVGSWTDKEDGVTFVFEPGDGKEYEAVVKEMEDGRELSSNFEVHLVRLGSFEFLDFLPKSGTDENSFYQVHWLRAHSLARVDLLGDAMEMAFFDAAWLKKKLEEKSVDIAHQNSGGTLLLTGTTREVQDLVSLHAQDEEAFPLSLRLRREEAQP